MSDDKLHKLISGALKSTIDAHGPITLNSIGSAAKRIVGLISTEMSKGDNVYVKQPYPYQSKEYLP